MLARLKAGLMQEKLTDEYMIGYLTVGDIKKNEDKIRSFASATGFECKLYSVC